MAAPFTILVIDDEQVMRDACDQILAREGCRVTSAASGAEGLEKIQKERFDVIILDLKMPGLSGMEVLARIEEEIPEIPVIVITGYATIESAVEAMKLGAYDFIPKPFTPNVLRTIVVRALEKRRLTLENAYLREELRTCADAQPLIGRSKAMQRVFRLIEKAGKTDSTLLISGESGTGKELVARAVHRLSIRKDGPFITVDCNSVVNNLFESELFGHEAGAFTGATGRRLGRFELADEGTIFLDEIGEIAPAVQVKLLRVLQEKEFVRVGGVRTIGCDVRVIAASNRDLDADRRERRFRDDLYYRLNVFPITIPPLRRRREDIPILAEHFLNILSAEMKTARPTVTDRAMQTLVRYDWPGNIRELQNILERACLLADKCIIDLSHLPPEITAMHEQTPAETPRAISQAGQDPPKSGSALENMEKTLILQAIREHNGNQTRTAKALGISRDNLRYRIKKYGISIKREGLGTRD